MSHPPESSENRTMPEMLSRGFWMLLGPMLLIPITFKIIEEGNGWLTAFDIAFWCLLAGMILARGFEFFKGRPRTSMGDPATPTHFRNYTLALVALAAGIWIVANLLGNYWLTSG